MKSEVYVAAGERLKEVRETTGRITSKWPMVEGASPAWPNVLMDRLREEEAGLVDMLVGDDPLVHSSLDWLRKRWEQSDLVLQDEDGPRITKGGNEHWVFADVQIGDDYGALDFEVEHAIWRNTGALYRIERDGSVADDPMFVPEGSGYKGPTEEARRVFGR